MADGFKFHHMACAPGTMSNEHSGLDVVTLSLQTMASQYDISRRTLTLKDFAQISLYVRPGTRAGICVAGFIDGFTSRSPDVINMAVFWSKRSSKNHCSQWEPYGISSIFLNILQNPLLDSSYHV